MSGCRIQNTREHIEVKRNTVKKKKNSSFWKTQLSVLRITVCTCVVNSSALQVQMITFGFIEMLFSVLMASAI